MSLKALLFDLGLTLIETAPFPEIYRRILARFDVTALLDDIVRAQKATEGEFEIATYVESRRKKFWINYNLSLLKKLGIEEKQVFLAAKIDELWWECSHVQIYQDVEFTLSQLRAKSLKLGLVSNGFKKDLDYILGKYELEKWFDAVVHIDSCNCAKPNKEIFLYALEKLGVEPHEAIFVGDSVEYDYEGALNVGIKPLLIDREGKIPSRYNKIASLTELLKIV
jgi:putative hydrolase of the HAD superfamily